MKEQIHISKWGMLAFMEEATLSISRRPPSKREGAIRSASTEENAQWDEEWPVRQWMNSVSSSISRKMGEDGATFDSAIEQVGAELMTMLTELKEGSTDRALSARKIIDAEVIHVIKIKEYTRLADECREQSI